MNEYFTQRERMHQTWDAILCELNNNPNMNDADKTPHAVCMHGDHSRKDELFTRSNMFPVVASTVYQLTTR